MESGTIIRDRYRVEERIGKGAQGETWRAADLSTDSKVVLKIFEFTEDKSWGGFDRFESEARVLRGIDHPRIPDYIDQFEVSTSGAPRFVLAQEYIAGDTIKQRVSDGRRETMVEIERLASELLDIVRYMQSVSPVIIHRDVNPGNVIVDEGGRVYLVDFGGARDAFRSTGSTVIGTPGFVPLEQFAGRATSRSDLYGFAATMIYLLTHRNPTDLPVSRLKIDIGAACPGISRPLEIVLSSYLEPDEDDRNLPVSEAIGILRGEIDPAPKSVSRGTQYSRDASRDEGVLSNVPLGSKIAYSRSADGTEIVTLPALFLKGKGIVLLPFVLFWNGFVAVWTLMATSLGAPVAFTLFSIPFWAVGIGMLVKLLRNMFERVVIQVTGETAGEDKDGARANESARFRLKRSVGPFKRTIDLPVTEIGAPMVDRSHTRNERAIPACAFEAGVKRMRIGAELSEREIEWLCSFIRRHAKG